MSWIVWLAAGLAWLTSWAILIAACASRKDGDAAVRVVGILLPVFCAATFLAAFLALHKRGPVFHNIILWTHHASILLLFLFLVVAEYLQLEAWLRTRRGSSAASVAQCIRALWGLSEIAPAPIALTIFLTGLRLIWDIPQLNSPANGWLSILILAFSFFFWDGMLGYRPIVRQLWNEWKRREEQSAQSSGTLSFSQGRVGAAQLFLHFLSWPFVFLVGLKRWPTTTFLSQPIRISMKYMLFLPDGWPGVISAVLLWTLAGILVSAVRTALYLRRVAGAVAVS